MVELSGEGSGAPSGGGGPAPEDVARRVVSSGVAPCAAAGWAARRGPRAGSPEGRGRWEISRGGASVGVPETEAARAFFDLASLTKPMTAFAIARSGADRESAIARHVLEALGTPVEDASLELLLAHRAGLVAHLPLYGALARGEPFRRGEAIRAAALARRPDAEGPIPGDGFAPVYSDLGYVLAGEALARSTAARDAGEAIEQLVAAPLGLDELGTARALSSRPVDFARRVAPTEVVRWRGGEVRGRVHDENAWALTRDGGSGHAGMFGTIDAVLAFGCAALDAIARGEGPLAAGDLSWLVRPRPGGSLLAGFDARSAGGYSSIGERAGPRTFGHLGFTGTSLWIDPDAEVVVALLTNRVHPTRDNDAIRAARPVAHDALFAAAAKG